MNHLKINLKYLRSVSGFTQEAMGQYFGRDKSLIGAWESGRSIPNLKDLKELSDLYSVSIHWLVFKDLSVMKREGVFKNYNRIQKRLNGKENEII